MKLPVLDRKAEQGGTSRSGNHISEIRLGGFRAKKNLSPPLNRQVMGLRCQSKKSLSNLLLTQHHQQSDCSNAEEGIGGGFGDCSHNKSFLNVISILGAGIVECYY